MIVLGTQCGEGVEVRKSFRVLATLPTEKASSPPDEHCAFDSIVPSNHAMMYRSLSYLCSNRGARFSKNADSPSLKS